MLFYNELLFYTCGCWGSAGQRSWVVVVVDIVNGKQHNINNIDNLAQIDDIVDIDLMYISSISSIYQK